MALSPTDAFKREIGKASFAPVILVQLQLGGQNYYWCCARKPLAIGGAGQLVENIVTDVSGIGRSIDALTRAVSISEASVTFDRSEYLRSLFSKYRLFGQPVTITWGPETLAGSAAQDFLPLWAGVVTDIEPEEGQITLRCHDLFTVLSGDISSYSAVDKHPLQIVLDLLIAAGVPSSIIDADSFNPDRYAGGTYPISHWNTTRSLHEGVDRRITSQTSISSLLTEVGLLLNGAFLIDEAGKLAYRVYDPAIAPVDNWTYDDIDEVKTKGTLPNIINHAVFRGAWDGTTNARSILTGMSNRSSLGVIGRVGNIARDSDGSNAGFQYSIVRDDFISQQSYAYPGQSRRQLSEHVESKWVGVMSYLVDSGPLITDPTSPSVGSVDATRSTADVFGLGATSQVGDWLRLGGAWISGFSGLPRYQLGASGAGVWDGKTQYLPDASAGRLVYLLVDSEIIACDACFAGSSTWLGIGGGTTNTNTIGNLGTGDVPPSGAPASACFRILQRGALGTSPAAHAGGGQPGGTAGTTTGGAPGASIVSSKVYDVTIPVAIVKQWLDRFADGCPEITVTTGLHKAHLQVGDRVTFPSDFYVSYGLLGLASDTVWELVGKDVLVTADSACCKWKLARSPAQPTYSNGAHGPSTIQTTGQQSSVLDGKTGNIPAAGGAGTDVAGLNTSKLGATTVSGLVATIGAGTFARPGISAGMPGTSLSLAPNKDTYVTFDAHSYGYAATAVPTGAPPPLVPDSHGYHSKLAAGASSAALTPLVKSTPLTSSIVGPSSMNSSMDLTTVNQNPSFAAQSDPSQPPDGWSLVASSPAGNWPPGTWGTNLTAPTDSATYGTPIGGRYLRIAAGIFNLQSSFFGVLPGQQYRLNIRGAASGTFDWLAAGGGPAALSFYIWWVQADGVTLSAVRNRDSLTPAGSAVWAINYAYLTAPSDAAFAFFEIQAEAVSGSYVQAIDYIGVTGFPDSGTVFPSNPVAGDRFFRTDRRIEYVFVDVIDIHVLNLWMSVEEYAISLEPYASLPSAALSATTNNVALVTAPSAPENQGGSLGGTQIYLTTWDSEISIGATNNGSNYYNLGLSDSTGTNFASYDTNGMTPSSGWNRTALKVNSLRTVATDKHYLTNLTKVLGTPTSVNVASGVIHYRLVG